MYCHTALPIPLQVNAKEPPPPPILHFTPPPPLQISPLCVILCTISLIAVFLVFPFILFHKEVVVLAAV